MKGRKIIEFVREIVEKKKNISRKEGSAAEKKKNPPFPKNLFKSHSLSRRQNSELFGACLRDC